MFVMSMHGSVRERVRLCVSKKRFECVKQGERYCECVNEKTIL